MRVDSKEFLYEYYFYMNIWLTFMGLFVPASAAFAGAWTISPGQYLSIVTVSHYRADEQFSPLRGRVAADDYQKTDVQLYQEYGLREWLTLGGKTSYQTIRQENEDFIQRNSGIGQSELFTRFRVWSDDNIVQHTDEAVVSIEPLFAAPAQYQYARPVGDNTDWAGELAVLTGYSFAWLDTYHFISTRAGYRTRRGEQADQWRYEAMLGLRPSDGWLMKAQLNQTHAADHGKDDAFTFGGNNNYNLSTGQLSVLYHINARYAVELGAARDIAGSATGAGERLFASMWIDW